MNVNGLLLKTLQPFGCPVEQDLYEGKETRYFVYTYAAETATGYADNAPQRERFTMYVNLYLPREENYLRLKKGVKKALFAAGFTYPDVEQILDGNMRHIIFECSIEGAIETEE